MSSKELPKKIILVLLSVIFLTFAPMAINTYLVSQIGVGNAMATVLEGLTSRSLSTALKDTCSRIPSISYSECETLALGQLCLQYADPASCQDVGPKGKDYFVKNVALPSLMSKVNEMQIPKTAIKVGELDQIINSVFLVSIALTLVSVILMVMLISTPKNVLRALGTNIILIGLPMFLLAYAGEKTLPSLIEQAGAEIADPATISSMSAAIMPVVKIFLDGEKQIGIVLTLLGLVAIVASKTFFKEKRLLRK
ncbi:MAG: hypothetical protein HY051_02560 [Candidatus Aenigmarchaeota archaeon]|nr:hypothetical protein [Candidatus Aenigmarchaeota archaeon]